MDEHTSFMQRDEPVPFDPIWLHGKILTGSQKIMTEYTTTTFQGVVQFAPIGGISLRQETWLAKYRLQECHEQGGTHIVSNFII